jgi:hypothetical protein
MLTAFAHQSFPALLADGATDSELQSGASDCCLNPLHDTHTNARRPRGLHDSGALGEEAAYRSLPIYREQWSAKAFALGPSPSETSFDTLDNHRSLELSENAQHLKHRFASRGAGVNPLLVQVKIHALCV